MKKFILSIIFILLITSFQSCGGRITENVDSSPSIMFSGDIVTTPLPGNDYLMHIIKVNDKTFICITSKYSSQSYIALEQVPDN